MSIKLRLSRGGRKKVPFYSIIATNSTSPRDSKLLEKIGTFNPFLNDDNAQKLVLNKERAEYWISVGAKPSERVAGFLIKLGIKEKAKGTGAKKKALEAMAKAKEAAEKAQEEAAQQNQEVQA